jgi:ubiquinone/menaquinone biosynthesis C-methylase UbiE
MEVTVVDVGCGSGKWPMEVAQQFPQAKVVGFDLSPIERRNKPANCEFIVGDLNKGLPFADNSMDLVHSR